MPGPPFPLYLAGAELVAAYPMGPIMEGAGLNITVLSYRDAVDFGFMADPELVPDVWELADHVQTAFAELKAAAAGEVDAANGKAAERPRPAPRPEPKSDGRPRLVKTSARTVLAKGGAEPLPTQKAAAKKAPAKKAAAKKAAATKTPAKNAPATTKVAAKKAPAKKAPAQEGTRQEVGRLGPRTRTCSRFHSWHTTLLTCSSTSSTPSPNASRSSTATPG